MIAEVAIPALERARRRLGQTPTGRGRSKTMAANRLTLAERAAGAALEYPDVERPQTRGDCEGGERPCPFVSCAHHLYLDVNDQTGGLKLNFPHLDVEELADSCALDVADRGGITLEEAGKILNLTRERVRQIEVRGLSKVRMVVEPS